MKQSLHALTVSSIRLKDFTLTKTYHSQTSSKSSCSLHAKCSARALKSVCAHLTSHSQSHQQKWTSAATFAAAKDAHSASTRAGLKSSDAAWFIQMFSNSTELTAKPTRDTPSAWAWSESQTSNIRLRICVCSLKTTCASSKSSKQQTKSSYLSIHNQRALVSSDKRSFLFSNRHTASHQTPQRCTINALHLFSNATASTSSQLQTKGVQTAILNPHNPSKHLKILIILKKLPICRFFSLPLQFKVLQHTRNESKKGIIYHR